MSRHQPRQSDYDEPDDGGPYGDVPNIPLDFTPPTMSHPNRNPNSASASPKGAQVRAARMAANLTAGAAGALVYERATRWLAFELGNARMHPATWELFNLKLAQRHGLGLWQAMAAEGDK